MVRRQEYSKLEVRRSPKWWHDRVKSDYYYYYDDDDDDDYGESWLKGSHGLKTREIRYLSKVQ